MGRGAFSGPPMDFRWLEQAVLLTVEPYKGATVRAMSFDELEQMYEVCIMLEAEAVRRGATSADDLAVESIQRHWALLQVRRSLGKAGSTQPQALPRTEK